MPTNALSLVGFLDHPAAINHLRNDCVLPDTSDAALTDEWNTARARLGPAIANAGKPDIQPIPSAHEPHIEQLLEQWQPGPGILFQLVEIDPLLALQSTVDRERADHHCGAFNRPPQLAELVPCCLPLGVQTETIQFVRGPQSLIVRARSLNVELQAQGMLASNTIGIQFGLSLAYVHVVRFNGKCYLHNGIQRTYGARIAGATHIPCVFRDVADHAAVGIKTDGATFSATLLESNNPPTLAHFTQGRAHRVRMKIKSRVLHVSWAEYVVPEE